MTLDEAITELAGNGFMTRRTRNAIMALLHSRTPSHGRVSEDDALEAIDAAISEGVQDDDWTTGGIARRVLQSLAHNGFTLSTPPETIAAPIPVEGEVIRNATLRLMAAATKIERDVRLLDLTTEEYESLARAALDRLTFSRGVDERAQIVAWLRGVDHNLPLTIARVVADAIERGDHLSTIEEPRG